MNVVAIKSDIVERLRRHYGSSAVADEAADEIVLLRSLLIEGLDISDASVPRTDKENAWRDKCATALNIHQRGAE
jgi:hypothetical protein